MSIQTATKIAIAGVSIGLLMSLAAPFSPWLLLSGDPSTYQDQVRLLSIYQMAKAGVLYGSILIFLGVLASKQKERS